MVLSDVSIKRPVLATVFSLILIIFGLMAFRSLPVREYPAIDPPIVSITTVYTGASAAVIEALVTPILEGAVAGIEGVRTITSTTRDEFSRINVEFHLSREIESAANDVRDNISRVLSRLPAAGSDLQSPVVAKVDSDAFPIMFLTLTSDRANQLELSDYAARYLIDRFATLTGVSSARITGERKLAMRIWLDRRAMASRGVTLKDVEDALKKQNIEMPAGRVESSQREFTVRADAGLRTPEEFRRIVVGRSPGYLVRLGEIANVERGAANERSEFRANGEPAIGIAILKQSTANTLEVSRGVRAEVTEIAPTLPPGMQLVVNFDASLFIEASIGEVFHALSVALTLVLGVIFFFLRSVRATLIPALAIPVSITASFAVLSAMGFSINILTLLAYVLAIGLVVDDAIVVLENIHRRIEEGEPPLLAAYNGARQIGFAVVATTAVLIAVFVPISFQSGNIGRLFGEFGLSMAAAVVFSGFVALTLTPMLCSKLLRSHASDGWLVRVTEPLFVALNRGYAASLKATLRVPWLVVLVTIGVTAGAVGLFRVLPRELAPIEDQASFFIDIRAPEGSTMAHTRDYLRQVEDEMMKLLEEEQAERILSTLAVGFGVPGAVNTARVTVRLKAWGTRTRTQQEIVRSLFPKLLAISGVRAIAINSAPLGQRGVRPPVQVVIGGSTYEELAAWRDKLAPRLAENPHIGNVNFNYDETKPQLRVEINRDRAADLGITLDELARTLDVMLGARAITTLRERGEQYDVMVQARSTDRGTANDLSNIYMRATGGTLVPLSSLMTVKNTAGAAELTRVDRLRSIIMSAQLAPGASLGEALESVEAIIAQELPRTARIGYQGQSREFKESSTSLYFTFVMALIIVFLVLAAQFESWVHPGIILLSVPLAITGALGALAIMGLTMNVYSQIGMVMLIGLVAKNAILIVEFSNQLRDQGMAMMEAVAEASLARFRPIIMTSIATIGGAWPLATASGAGAEGRVVIGVVVVGGVAFSTMLTLYVVPVFYSLLARRTKPASYISNLITQMQQAGAGAQGAQAGHAQAGHGKPAPAGVPAHAPAE